MVAHQRVAARVEVVAAAEDLDPHAVAAEAVAAPGQRLLDQEAQQAPQPLGAGEVGAVEDAPELVADRLLLRRLEGSGASSAPGPSAVDTSLNLASRSPSRLPSPSRLLPAPSRSLRDPLSCLRETRFIP